VEKRELLSLLVETYLSGQLRLSPEKAQLLKDYQDCRTVAKGCQIFWCDTCQKAEVIFNPCNKRGCPSCHKKSQLHWGDKTKKRLLRTGHFHLVFSFPQEVTQLWLKDERATVEALFRVVGKAVRKLMKSLGLKMGFILVFQSHGKGMSYKAHIHCLITDGGLDREGNWQSAGVLALAKMTEWVKEGFGEYQNQKGWDIHVSRHSRGGDAVVQYLGSRLSGVVTNIDGLSREGEMVRIQDRGGSVILKQAVFVERFFKHIPAKGMVTTRNYGLYSNRQSQDYQRAKSELKGLDHDEVPQEPYKEVCPKCQGELRLVAVWAARSKPDFVRWGYGVGPPGHREMSDGKAS